MRRLVKTPVCNVLTGPHASKLRVRAQTFRISQTPEGANLSEHMARKAKESIRKVFAWGRDIGPKNYKFYITNAAVEHKEHRNAHICDLMDELKAQNEAAGREFRWTYGPTKNGLPSAIWSLRYLNVDHTITGTVVYGL